MTKHRPAGSIEAALLEALNDLTDRELGEVLGKSRSYLYACADPAKREQLHFADAVKLDRALAAKGLPLRFKPIHDNELGQAAAPVSVGALTARLTDGMKELGDVAALTATVSEDGIIDAAERRRLAKEWHDVEILAAQQRALLEPSGLAAVQHKGSPS